MRKIHRDACVELLLALRNKPGLLRSNALAELSENYPQFTHAMRKDAEFVYMKQGEESVVDWFEKTFDSY